MPIYTAPISHLKKKNLENRRKRPALPNESRELIAWLAACLICLAAPYAVSPRMPFPVRVDGADIPLEAHGRFEGRPEMRCVLVLRQRSRREEILYLPEEPPGLCVGTGKGGGRGSCPLIGDSLLLLRLRVGREQQNLTAARTDRAAARPGGRRPQKRPRQVRR